MKKISKEELMKQMNLTEEEMEKVTGGNTDDYLACCKICKARYGEEMNESRIECIKDCIKDGLNP